MGLNEHQLKLMEMGQRLPAVETENAQLRSELAALREQEPVAWLVEHDDYPKTVELPDETHTPETIEKEEAMGWRLTPLYAAAQPGNQEAQ